MIQYQSEGLFDLQVNGYAAVDFNDPAITAEKVDKALYAMLQDGVTGCLPTLITASLADLKERFNALDNAVTKSELGAKMVPGYHLEGPFLNKESGYIGCHPKEETCDPDPEIIKHLEKDLNRPILLVTLAPELKGSIATIKTLRETGKVIAIGHSAAGYDTVQAAVDAGISLSTHLGNGLPSILPKLENTLLAQLGESQLSGCFIADGHHISPQALKNMIKIKGVEKSILVTDAVVAARSEPGSYTFAGLKIERGQDGIVRSPGQINLAGSSLCLKEAVKNLVNWNISTFEQATRMASTNARNAIKRALDYHNIILNPDRITWNEDLFLDQGKPIQT
ncbi:MAG: N-acetylglucosamine-6-phosphate deacetylase [Alphaproteobacteria bacterium]|nr:MAG: N-acetylglucosamine-6-phosphate deacetylase [Alphaproteobacteria bacterium]